MDRYPIILGQRDTRQGRGEMMITDLVYGLLSPPWFEYAVCILHLRPVQQIILNRRKSRPIDQSAKDAAV
jgi:hypothetical protein